MAEAHLYVSNATVVETFPGDPPSDNNEELMQLRQQNELLATQNTQLELENAALQQKLDKALTHVSAAEDVLEGTDVAVGRTRQ